jgi:rhodanese/phosphatase family protein
VLRRRGVVLCRQSAQHWYADDRALCVDEKEHGHEHFEVHVHRDSLRLPDGGSVTAASFDADDPYGRETVPDFGLYLDDQWMPPWPHDHISWPDFGVPADPAALGAALKDAARRAREGQVVELGCVGGHGRTGTALACLITLTGERPQKAVAWVRANYCDQPIETREQEGFVSSFAAG